jgi:hypothetical protein
MSRTSNHNYIKFNSLFTYDRLKTVLSTQRTFTDIYLGVCIKNCCGNLILSNTCHYVTKLKFIFHINCSSYTNNNLI